MENFPEKMQELQDQGLLEELTPEETEALKGGYWKLSRDYFPIGIPYPWFNKGLLDQGPMEQLNVQGG